MIHIYRPTPTLLFVKVYYCRKCKKRRRHQVKSFEYYGPLIQCLKCNKQTSVG